jgi:drug/metabolite transporter (DMT)-like permease
MPRTRANLMLLATGAIWGLGFVAQSTAMDAIGPLLFIGLRFAAATLAMLPLALRETGRAGKPLTQADWGSFLVVGLLIFFGMAAQQYGLLTTSVTNSGFLTGLYVVMTPFLVVLLFRQWPHPVVWPAAFGCLFGVYLLSGGNLDRLTRGDWLTILCAFFWALQVIFVSRYGQRTGRPVTLAVTQFAVCAVLGLTGGIALEEVHWPSILLALPEILYAGIVAGGIAFTIQAIAQRHTSAAQAAIFLASEAVFAALFGALVLMERPPAMALAGCAIIFAAMLAVEIVPAFRPSQHEARIAGGDEL